MLLGPIVDAPVEEWDRMVALNVQGLLYVAHAALPHLLQAAESDPRRVADLVNISSVAGRRVGAGGGVYQLTKHGVGAFSESLRQEVTERHVRVVAGRARRDVDAELHAHLRPEIRDAADGGVGGEPLHGRGHRRRDRLRRHAPAPRGDQRGAGAADRAGALSQRLIARPVLDTTNHTPPTF